MKLMVFGINKSIKSTSSILKNPITLWIKWYVNSLRILHKNKDKHLKIGYLATLNNVEVGQYNTLYDKVSISNSKINDFVYIASETIIKNATIGKFCSIGSNVKIGLGIHPLNFISTFPAFYSINRQCQITFSQKNYVEEFGYINIGNDVWIGANAIIMDNVKIGDGAVIAAGAVVTKNVDPYCIVGGVPAKIIKRRFPEKVIIKLLEIKWWEKDIEWINKHHIYFIKNEEFIDLFK